jgi:hypothetical protein
VFLNTAEAPVVGIRSECLANGGKLYLSEAIAKELNENQSLSNESGILHIHYKARVDGGSYNYKGDRTWGQTPMENVNCNFYLNEKLVYTENIKNFNRNSPTVLHLENI